MTNLEWIKSMDAEQMVREVLCACERYTLCRECKIRPACTDSSKAMEWLMEEHEEAKG